MPRKAKTYTKVQSSARFTISAVQYMQLHLHQKTYSKHIHLPPPPPPPHTTTPTHQHQKTKNKNTPPPPPPPSHNTNNVSNVVALPKISLAPPTPHVKPHTLLSASPSPSRAPRS